jgi:DNA-binding response OmpR family regulator
MSFKPRVVVVEDEPLSRDMLVRRLTGRSFEVVAFTTAREAVAHLEREPADIVLMDNALPEVSGVEAVRLLRQHWSHDSLPIIIVSAMIDSDDVVEALDAGANDYVVKPINFKVLLARVRTALTIRANVSALVEAERQRVVMESLGKAAASIAGPMERMVDELESLMQHPPDDPARLASGLAELLDITERAVDVIDQLRKIAEMHNVPYTARLDFLNDVGQSG